MQLWKSQEFPAIRAEAKKTGASIYFADEAGIRSDYHSGTTWAPVGRTPVVANTGARWSLNMLSAVSAQGKLRFMVHDGKVNSGVFIDFCKRLLRDADTPVYLVVDGHPCHRSRATKEFIAATEGRLKLFFLPGYSPELNPDEWDLLTFPWVGSTASIGHFWAAADAAGRSLTCPLPAQRVHRGSRVKGGRRPSQRDALAPLTREGCTRRRRGSDLHARTGTQSRCSEIDPRKRHKSRRMGVEERQARPHSQDGRHQQGRPQSQGHQRSSPAAETAAPGARFLPRPEFGLHHSLTRLTYEFLSIAMAMLTRGGLCPPLPGRAA